MSERYPKKGVKMIRDGKFLKGWRVGMRLKHSTSYSTNTWTIGKNLEMTETIRDESPRSFSITYGKNMKVHFNDDNDLDKFLEDVKKLINSRI